MTRTLLATLTLGALGMAAFSMPALAQEPPPPPPAPGEPPPPAEMGLMVTAEPEPPSFGVGAKIGVLLPQIATELTTAVTGGIELSFNLPFARRRVAIYAEVAYSQPKVSRSDVADPRLTGGPYDGTQTQRELVAGGGILVRVLPPASVWNGYGIIGARGYFLETITVGSSGGMEFGENTEQSARFGGIFAVGGERLLGPGAALFEVAFGTSDLPHLITGDVSTSAIAIQLGYRFLF